MKKIAKFLAVAALVAGTAATAQAADFTFSDGVIELGKEYLVPDYASVEAKLTAPSTGTLIQTGCPDITLWLDGAELRRQEIGWVSGRQQFAWEVQEGVTYDATSFMVINAGYVMFAMEDQMGLELTECSPADGATVSSLVNYTGEIYVAFNGAVSCEGAALVVGEVVVTLSTERSSGNVLLVNVQNVMNNLYNNGTLDPKGGTKFQVVFYGIKSKTGELYNGDGMLRLSYVAAPRTTDLIDTNAYNGRQLKSYYPAGDPEGILTFVFDQNLKADAPTHLIISAGDMEGVYYYEVLPVKIDGATITADLTGKLRDLNGIAIQDMVGLQLSNVRDLTGQLAAGSGAGNVGSYTWTFVYDYIQPVDIVSEFLPASGKSLVGVSELEIWFTNSNMIRYDGVVFSYADGGEVKEIVVPKDELNITLEGNETTILVAVPTEVQGKPATVSLYNIVSLDGYDHSQQVMAYYDQFVATLERPVLPGARIAATGADDFVISVNDPDIAYMRYNFYNAEGECAGSEAFAKQSTGKWTAPNGNYPCYRDFTPYMQVLTYDSEAAYAADPDSYTNIFVFTFQGTAAPFEFSSYAFESITPAAGSAILVPVVGFNFTVAFDGLVRIDAAESGTRLGSDGELQPFLAVEPLNADPDNPEGFASEWALTPVLPSAPAKLEVVIAAYDQDSLLVEGTEGTRAASRLVFAYTVTDDAGIEGVEADAAASPCYNLQGMPVTQPKAGQVYIRAGKKIILF